MVHVLFGTVLTAAVVAGVRSMAGSPAPASDPTPVAEPAQERPAMPAMPAMAGNDDSEGDEQAPSAGIAGEVLEVIEVPNYSYLRVGAKGSDGTWVAVPTAGLSVGASVRVGSAMKMTDFKSTALNRTFPVIYFGTLDKGARAAAATGDNPHGAMGDNPHGAMGDNPHGGMSDSPHGAMGDNPHGAMGGGSNPHGAAGASTVDVKSVPRAEGANGKTVAEVIGQRDKLTGKTVRIRGTVVKVNAGILGRTYLHLRDGSGDASEATNDIVVTTESTPSLGDTVVIEGKVTLDKDIGSGYKFPTMVEDAKVL